MEDTYLGRYSEIGNVVIWEDIVYLDRPAVVGICRQKL
jgi:hypothetical protein